MVVPIISLIESEYMCKTCCISSRLAFRFLVNKIKYYRYNFVYNIEQPPDALKLIMYTSII